MRTALTLACLFAVSTGSAFATADIVLNAADAKVTEPMTLVDSVLHQPAKIVVPAESGTAVLTIKIPESGDYLIEADVNAPTSDANSFFINFDTPPQDPAMIWDVQRTFGDYLKRLVTWRGKGGVDDDEFDPKYFSLTAGEHQLIVTGREPAKLRSLTIRRYIKPAPGTLAAIQDELEKQRTAVRHEDFRLEDTAAGREAERKLYALARADHEKLTQQAIDLAEAHPHSAEGLAALDWAFQHGSGLYQSSALRATARFQIEYTADPQIGGTVAYLSHYRSGYQEPIRSALIALLESVVAKNPNRVVRAQAALGAANYAKDNFETQEYLRKGEEAVIAGKKAIDAMEAVRRDYGYVPYLLRPDDKRSIGDEATAQLMELRTLRTGMPAPEIADEDLNGARLKLSDYRGKVVMLVFWGSWCGPCMAAVPHERALAEKFQGRPFAIVGVNSDTDKGRALKAVAWGQMTWRSFWNGADWHISKAWNVKMWPTVYLIDHQGVIQQRVFPDDEAIEQLVAEAERKS